MKKSLAVLIILLFAGGGLSRAESLDAWEEEELSSSKQTQAQPGPVSQATSAPVSTTVRLDSNWDLRVYSGLDVSLMDDLVSGMQTFANYVQDSFSNISRSTSTFSRPGFLFGARVERLLNPQNSLLFGMESVMGTGGTDAILATNGEVQTVMVDPTLVDLSLNYRHYFSPEKDGGSYLGLGGGWYHTNINYSDTVNVPGGNLASGSFTGDCFGATLELGQEWKIGDSVGIELWGRLRWAVIDKVTSTNLAGAVINPADPQTWTLGIERIKGLVYGTTNDIDSSNGLVQYAVVDYSGADLGLSFVTHF